MSDNNFVRYMEANDRLVQSLTELSTKLLELGRVQQTAITSLSNRVEQLEEQARQKPRRRWFF